MGYSTDIIHNFMNTFTNAIINPPNQSRYHSYFIRMVFSCLGNVIGYEPKMYHMRVISKTLHCNIAYATVAYID